MTYEPPDLLGRFIDAAHQRRLGPALIHSNDLVLLSKLCSWLLDGSPRRWPPQLRHATIIHDSASLQKGSDSSHIVTSHTCAVTFGATSIIMTDNATGELFAFVAADLAFSDLASMLAVALTLCASSELQTGDIESIAS